MIIHKYKVSLKAVMQEIMVPIGSYITGFHQQGDYFYIWVAKENGRFKEDAILRFMVLLTGFEYNVDPPVKIWTAITSDYSFVAHLLDYGVAK